LLEDLLHEEFYVLFLNRANRVIRTERLSIGGVSGTVVDHRIIFRWALEKLASGLVLAHNHPSGQLKPSAADIQLTQRIKEAGALFDIHLLDHIIVGNGNYFSFADEGIL
jgi:DNA repair protein RadC